MSIPYPIAKPPFLKGKIATAGATATIIKSIAIPTNEIKQIDVHATAYKADGVQLASFNTVRSAKNVSGTVTLQGAPIHKYRLRSKKTLAITFVVNSTSIDVKVTGLAATALTWKVKILVT